MANQKISQFTYTSSITGDELIGVAINGENKAISTGTFLAYADNTVLMQEHEKRLNNITFNLTANEMLAHETAEKVSVVVNTVADMEEANHALVSYINGAFEEIHEDMASYVTQIQKNSDLIAHVEADVIKISSAQGKLGERVASNIEVLNDHTATIQNLHTGLMSLSDTVSQQGQELTYLSTYVYPVIDNSYERVCALEESLASTDATLQEHMDLSYASFNEIIAYANALAEKLNSSYAYLNEYIESTYYNATRATETSYEGLSYALETKSYENWQFIADVNNDLNETRNYFNTRIDNTETRITNNEANINTLNNRITTNVSVLSANIETVKNELLVNDANNVEYLEGEIDKLRQDAAAADASLQELIDTNASSIASNTTAIEKNAENIVTINDTLSNHFDKIAEHENRIISLESLTEEHDERIEKLEEFEAETKTHLSEHDADIADHQKQLNGVKDNIDDLHADITRIMTDVTVVKDTVSTNTNRLDNQLEQIHNLCEITDGHTSEIISLKSRVSNLESFVEDECKPKLVEFGERIYANEDNIAHLAWHESHPESSIWATFSTSGLKTNCGYKSERTPHGCES